MERTPRDDGAGDVGPIARSLRRLRRVARTLLAVDAVALVLIAAAASAMAVGLFDYVFVTPVGLRLAVWTGGIVAAGLALWRLLRPAAMFRPSLSDLALRVERTPEGEQRGLRGVLASGLEFSRSLPPEVERDATSAALARHVVREAVARFSPSLVFGVLRPRRPVARLGTLAGVAVVVGAMWLAAPVLMGIGAARVLTPWSGAMWPTRTALANATEARVHDIGRPLALDADLTRTDRGRGQTRVWASYRLRVPSGGGTVVGATRRVAMMWQAGDGDERADAGEREGRGAERYSWLHTDLAGEAAAVVGAAGGGESPSRAGARPEGVEFEVEYWFETADAATAPARVLVVEPPMVESASLRVEPPAYVDLRVAGDLAYVAGTVDLGSGTDERAKVGPILEGSRVEMAITFNKALDERLATSQGVLAGFGAPLAAFEPEVRIEGRTVRISAVLSVIESGTAATGEGAGVEPTLGGDAGPGLGGASGDAAAASTMTIEIPVRIADRHGLRSERESMFRLVVGADQTPTASVTEPATDESVLATAVVPVTGEGIDDAGVASVALERQRATTPAGSEGASPEAVGAAQVFAESNRLDPHLRRRTVDAMLDLSTLGVRVGDEVWITARATDTYALGDRRHAPARSAPRRLRIISQTELIDQIRQDLAGVREAAIRLDEAQARLIASVSASSATLETARAQAGVSASIEDQQRYVDRLSERIERNRLEDEPLSLLVQDVASTLDGAATASTSATARLDQAMREREARAGGAQPRPSGSQQRSTGQSAQSRQQRPGENAQRGGEQGERGQSGSDQGRSPTSPDAQAADQGGESGAEADANSNSNSNSNTNAGDASDNTPIDEQAAQAIQQDQREVRDELQRLAALLDSGTDGWLVRREIERLIEEQQGLMRETREAGASTAGRDVSSLSPQERTELERIAQRQQELAEAVQDAIDELSQRARDMQDVDAAQAAGMRAAAQTGRERQASENLEQASQQISQNNTNSAGQQQQQALDALSDMLDDLEEGQRNRDEALQRVLASIVESIDALIADQERAIGDLGAAVAASSRGVADAGAGLDRAMITIHANTLGVMDEIRTGYPELGGVSRILGSAASAQTDAISALRSSPIAFEPAGEGESLSLSRLREARAEAKRLEEEAARRENARIRRELRQAYRRVLEQQVAIRGDVEAYVLLDLSRRQRAEVRTLGERQETLRVGLDTILRETKELADASVFRLAHARMDRLLLDASEALRGGRAERGVLSRQQGTIEILQSIVQALDDSQNEQDPFDSAQSGGGGGGGGGGGQEQPVIIPVHELRILRGMQEQALGLTRELDSAAGAAHPNEVAELAALQRSLAEEASALVQRMQREQGGAPGTPAGGAQE
ncbi:MAG: hypothetical protein KDA05_03955 [Phycisphaerales bacterium]|nr:hypothetical protein [Phycisphaerales bacterium]